jgi:hypothetical protein
MLAGKTQRKYTLLGRPGSGIAAVIVEVNRFAYVYHETPANEAYGTHQACLLLFYTLRCCSCSAGTDLCVSIPNKECEPPFGVPQLDIEHTDGCLSNKQQLSASRLSGASETSVSLLQLLRWLPMRCLHVQVLDLDLPREASVLGAALDTRTSVKPALYILLHDCIKRFDISG